MGLIHIYSAVPKCISQSIDLRKIYIRDEIAKLFDSRFTNLNLGLKNTNLDLT